MVRQHSDQSGGKRQKKARYKSNAKFAREEVDNLNEIVLEKAVWSRGLPHDVLCIILACLPLSSFFRLRSVCKKWSIISQDPIFIDNYSRVSSQEASHIIATWDRDGTTWMYENGLNAWKCIPPSFSSFSHRKGLWSPAVGSRLLLTKNSGRHKVHGYSLMVTNPLNGMQQALPPMVDEYPGRRVHDIIYEIRVVGMFMHPSKNYYKNNYYNSFVMDKEGRIMSDEEDEEAYNLEPEMQEANSLRHSALIQDETASVRMADAVLVVRNAIQALVGELAKRHQHILVS